jgi:hypothetical protein
LLFCHAKSAHVELCRRVSGLGYGVKPALESTNANQVISLSRAGHHMAPSRSEL